MAGELVSAMPGPTLSETVSVPGFLGDMERCEEEVSRLELRHRANPQDLQIHVRLLYRLFHRASLSGRMEHFEQAAGAVDRALSERGPKEDICLLKANLALRFHRLGAVKQALEMAPALAGRAEGQLLLADVDLQEGRWNEAAKSYETLIATAPTWDRLARLAHLKGKLGELDEAETLYLRAEDELTAKQMLSFAWLEIQRGLMMFQRGRDRETLLHYQRADAAYPGHWFVAEHFSELLAAQGRFDKAIPMLREVIARTDKPELKQALGEMYLSAGREDLAQPWFEIALEHYLSSVRRGDVHYFHHLADYYSGPGNDPERALEWAMKDLELRSNPSTETAVAWAFYRVGRVEEALSFISRALEPGVRDAIIFQTAAEIFDAAGHNQASLLYSSEARAINPMPDRFHMHH